MKDEIREICWALFCVMCGFGVGLCAGQDYGKQRAEKEAIAAGAAHWTINATSGEKKFEYLKAATPNP